MSGQAVPLNADQIELLTAAELAGSRHLYNSLIRYDLEGEIDEALLRERWSALQDHVPTLTMRVVDGAAGQELAPSLQQAPFIFSDRSGQPSSDLDRRLAVEAARPLDLRRGPLARLVLIMESARRARLLIVVSHVIADEVSGLLMARALLEGVMPADAPAETAVAVGASGPREPRRDERDTATVRFFTDRGRSDGDVEAAEASADEDIVLADASVLLADVALMGVTVSSATIAALGWVLSRKTGEQRVGMATSVSLRGSAQCELVTYLSRTVEVRAHVDEAGTARDYLRGVHASAIATYRAERRAVARVVPVGSEPLQVAVVQRDAFPAHVTDEFRAIPRDEPDPGVAQFGVVVYFQRLGGDLLVKVRYRRRLLARREARHMAEHLVQALRVLAENPDATLETLSFLHPDEEHELIELGRGAPAERPRQSIPELVHGWVQRRPGELAVAAGDRRLTYSDLWRDATTIVDALSSAGVSAGNRVGVCTRRSTEAVSAMLAALIVGAVYVPIDPDYPDERVSFIVRDAGLSVVLTDSDRLRDQEGLILVNIADATVGLSTPPREPVIVPMPADLAYIIYTSGSTGTPKGVQVTHANVAALAQATQGQFALRCDDRWSVLHSFAFDYAVWEIWGALLTGAAAIIADRATVRSPDDLLRFLQQSRITILSETPSGSTLLAQARGFATADLALRLVVFGGEALTPTVLRPWHERAGADATQLVNMYGITETTVHCTWNALSRGAEASTIGIGRPLPGWEVHVLDERRRPSPEGDIGEIWVGGNGVSAGYFGRPDLTAERFQLVTLGSREVLLYRSGDLARRSTEHDVEYLGRTDDQLEIGGHRIEPGEVVHSVEEHEGVSLAAVVPRVVAGAVIGLSAFFTGRAEEASVRDHVRTRLPAYMVPLSFRRLDSIPRTANGKTDFRALEALGSTRVPRTQGGPPASTGPEISLRRPSEPFLSVWTDVLGSVVEVDDNFFDLGGNSLLAVRLATALTAGGFPTRARDVLRLGSPGALWSASAHLGGRP